MKQMIAWSAALIALGTISSSPVCAQPAPQLTGAQTATSSDDIITSARSLGLEPLRAPVRKGHVYVLRARDVMGNEVRVHLDAQSARVLAIIPVAPGPYPPRPPAAIAMMPDATGMVLPPPSEDVALPVPPAERKPSSARPAASPLPRPRPKLAQSAAASAPAAAPIAASAAAAPTQSPEPAAPAARQSAASAAPTPPPGPVVDAE